VKARRSPQSAKKWNPVRANEAGASSENSWRYCREDLSSEREGIGVAIEWLSGKGHEGPQGRAGGLETSSEVA